MMTPLKTWCLLSLSVLLLSIAPTISEVLQSLTQCHGFLLGERSPEVPDILEHGQIQRPNRYKAICQTYNGDRRFVTLYDTTNKIPVLSGYKFTGGGTGRPAEIWKIEPQLEDPKSDKNMKDCNIHAVYNNQASDSDYKDVIKYNKGHLFPSSYASADNDKISTFTLTNSVPQVVSFNSGSWAKMETCVKCVLEQHCRNNNNLLEAYLLTGAQPGTEKLNNRVIIPSVLWSGFCCYSNTQRKWLASAFWANNVEDKSPDVYVATRTLQQLYDKLSTGSKTFSAFPGGQNCPLQETVARFYPEMDQNCHCQPQAPRQTKEAEEEEKEEGGGGGVIDSILDWFLKLFN
ncbi:Endonuclease domain-containing 1 protein [Channa argus]|uniref:Endonuclease domain-containing 1 protein n=1 Tax=Channa argus TaxID=215402 RepID=A0A6G1Q7E6_CHAAH|nr:Endonuclease domain-containing 1 protein [Channa argus]